MAKNKGYEIDFNTCTFTITKKYAEQATIYGSEEYNTLMNMRKDGFKIIVKKPAPRKACPTRITFEKMEIILSCMDHADERLAQLHVIMAAGKGQKNQYEYVRRWFLQNYPNFADVPVLDVNNYIVAPRIAYLPEDTEPLKLGA